MKARQTYSFVKDGLSFRIVDVQDEAVYYVFLDKNSYVPRKISKTQFLEQLNSGEIIRIRDPFLLMEVPKLKGKALEKSKRNWEWVRELWTNHKDELLDRNTRNKVVCSFAQSKGCTPKTIKNLLTNFFIKGMGKDSVNVKFNNCGKPGSPRELKKKPGPKGRPDSPHIRDLEKIFEKSYRRYYLNSPASTVQSAYDDMMASFFSKDGKIEPEKGPSYNQFWRWAKQQDLKERISKKGSQNTYDLNNRILTSSTSAQAGGPGDTFEIDATVLDCHIVSQNNKSQVIGRPILYLIIDRYSRMVVGMNVGLEGPSWSGAIAALENMVMDKVEYCRSYGINISRNDWPASNLVPYSLIGDRGEMISSNSSELVRNLQVRLHNTPPYRGDLKPNVERSFGVVNRKIRERIDGAVLKEYRKRGDRDPRDKARLDLNEITKVCIHCILYFNNRLIKGFPLSRDQIAFGVKPVPVELWNYGVDHYLQCFEEVDGETFRQRILPTTMKTTNRRGIRFKNLVYTAQDQKTKSWLENHQNEKVTFAYDPLDITEGYLRLDDNEFRLVLADTYSSFKGMSLEEYEQYNRLRKQEIKDCSGLNTQSSINLNKALDSINNSAAPIDRSVPKAVRKNSIRENRKTERINIKGNNQKVSDSIDKMTSFTDEQDPLADNYEAIERALEKSDTRKNSG